MVTLSPLHRSQRALLTHGAPASGHDGQPLLGMGKDFHIQHLAGETGARRTNDES